MTADYRCRDCGNTMRDVEFDRTSPPAVLDTRCCVKEPNDVVYEQSRYDRIYTPVAIGAVAGAGGSPAR